MVHQLSPHTAERASAAPTRVRRRRRRGRLGRRVGPYLFVLPAASFVFGLMVYPVLFNIQISFQDLNATNLLSGGAEWVGLDHYRTIFSDAVFLQALRHSLILTAASVVLQVGLGLALALLYNRPFPGGALMRSVFLVTYAVPIVVVGTVFRWLLDGRSGIVNSVLQGIGIIDQSVFWLSDAGKALVAVILINVWIGIPFNMIVLLAGLKSIPHEYHEAARVDGAGSFQRFRYITLPLLRPALLAVLMLGLIFTFKIFDLVWITTRGGPANATQILPTLSYTRVFQQFLFGEGAAILNVMFVVLFALAVLYLIALRREERQA